MIDGTTRLVLAIAAAGLTGATGCNSGLVDTHPVNWSKYTNIWGKIRNEGAVDLTEVEKIMGGKGVEIPNPCQPKGKDKPYVFRSDDR